MSVRTKNQAFTIIELIVVIVIISAIAGLAVPNFSRSYERAYEQDAVSQLETIYAANNLYFSRDRTYWPPDAATYAAAAVNSNLALNIIENGMTYTCTGVAGALTYSCRAERTGGTFRLKIDQTSAAPCCDNGSCQLQAACP